MLTRPVPLVAIEFPPDNDELAAYVGPRQPLSCPGLNHLIAQPETPPIRGAESVQHLTVPCPARCEVVGSDEVTAYSVCIAKAVRAGITPSTITDEWLTNPVEKRKIECPFVYLGGMVISGRRSVAVAIDARHPEKLEPIRRAT